MLKNLTIQKRMMLTALVPMLIIAVLAVGAIIFLDAATGIRPFGIFALVGLIVAGIVSVLLTQSIGSTLNETADAARQLSRAQEAVLIGDEEPLNNLAPLSTPDGELGDLHSALNSVQDGSRKVIASQRGAVKEGLATIVVDLARRNQSLIDRQVEFIEKLENNEEDPDKLENLFTVDHLATRMRRNAESLLVLAEAEPGKRRGGPVDSTDVIRVAIGEIENYQHINLGSVAPGRLSPTHAIDLAHLLAELMENATQSSPPETPVDVYSDQLEDAYVVSVADFGMGMTDELLAESNRTLADPPELGLAMTRSLGFVVVGRLAERLGASVQLYPSAETGVTAEIVLPNSLLLPASENESGTVTPDKAKFNEGEVTAITKNSSPANDVPIPEATTGSPAPAAKVGFGKENSTALDRLLGLGAQSLPTSEAATAFAAPADWADKSPFESTDKADSSALPARGKKSKPEPASATAAETVSGTWTPPEVTPGAPRPTELSEALPTGDALEAGMDSLLKTPEPGVTAAAGGLAGGLAKRSRSSSQAPKSEGRVLPEAGRPMVAANTRKPAEIRSMLLQYRAGLKGERPTEGGQPAEDSAQERRTEQDPS